MTIDEIRSLIADVPDFPKKGIIFKDITPLLQDPAGFAAVIELFAARYRKMGITQIVAPEARGFIFGAPLAIELGVGLCLIRKPGKLPRKTIQETYALEYGTDTIELHADALSPDDRVLILDDVLATGGTAAATVRLVEHTGAKVVELAFLMELTFLNGHIKLNKRAIYSLLKY